MQTSVSVWWLLLLLLPIFALPDAHDMSTSNTRPSSAGNTAPRPPSAGGSRGTSHAAASAPSAAGGRGAAGIHPALQGAARGSAAALPCTSTTRAEKVAALVAEREKQRRTVTECTRQVEAIAQQYANRKGAKPKSFHNLQAGLQLYRTLRTSSAVEGYHLHLSRCLAAGAKSAGIHWIDAVRCEFDYVWTVRMLRSAGWFGSAKHYNLQLIDRANAAMRSAKVGEAYKGWKETHVPDATKEAVVRHGVYYAQRAVRMREAAAAAAVRTRAEEADEGGEEEAGGGGGAAAAAAPAPVALVHATDAQSASDDHWMKHARLTLDASDIRAIVADTALHKAAATAVQSRAAEMGLVLPPEKAGKLLSAVLVKEKANAQLRAFGSLGVLSRLRRPAPSGVARTVVLLPTAPPVLAPPATSTVLPLAARAAGRSASFPPVAVPQAPVPALVPVAAAAAPAAAAAAAAAGAAAGAATTGAGGAGQPETNKEKAARVKREKRAAESPNTKAARSDRRAAKRNKTDRRNISHKM